MVMTRPAAPSAVDLLAMCDEVAHTQPGDTQKMASLLQKMILRYYEDVLLQAKQSFRSALGAAILGTLFFGLAVWMKDDGMVNAGLVAGAIVSVISGVNFWLYGKAARQFSVFHVCLERTNRFMLANTMCESMESTTRDQLRAELVRIVASAPMLTADMISGKAV